MHQALRTVWRGLCSLKFAVVTVSSIAIACTVATILESVYDTPTAQYWVYRSTAFYALLALMGVNVLCVALSRWPWRWRHGPFLIAHLGLLALLLGSWFTFTRGVDGMLRLEEGQDSARVELAQSYLAVSRTGEAGDASAESYTRVEIPWTPPNARFEPIAVPGLELEVDAFLARAEFRAVFEPDPSRASSANSSANPSAKMTPAFRVRVAGGPMRISQDYWLWSGGDSQWKVVQAGPARLFVTDAGTQVPARASDLPVRGGIWLGLFPAQPGVLHWVAGRSGEEQLARGQVRATELARGEPLELAVGWRGGVRVTLQEWIPHARVRTEYRPARELYGNDPSMAAIRLRTRPKDGAPSETLWLGLGDRASFEQAGRELRLAFLPRQVVMPFRLRLERFEIAHDAGTLNPASYASEVSVLSDRTEATPERRTWIRMNEPLEQAGYTLYQASFEPPSPGAPSGSRPTVSIFSVNQDPGRRLKYLGSLLLVIGSIWLFAARWARARTARLPARLSASPLTPDSRSPARSPMSNPTTAPILSRLPIWVVGWALAAAFVAARPSLAATPRGWDLSAWRDLPMQERGRIKPLDSFARESVLMLTGSRRFEDWEPAELVLSILAEPEAWEERALLRVGVPEVRRQLGLAESESRFAAKVLVSQSHLLSYAEALGGGGPPRLQPAVTRKSDPKLEELKRVVERFGLFQSLVSGSAWTLVPPATTGGGGPAGAWLSLLPGPTEAPEVTQSAAPLRAAISELVQAYRRNDAGSFDRASQRVRSLADAELERFSPGTGRSLAAESLFNRTRPFQLAWALYLLAALALALASAMPPVASARAVRAAFVLNGLALGLHIAGIAVRSLIAGRPPVTNMYESVIWVAFGVQLFGWLVYAAQRQRIVLGVAAALAALSLIVADLAPGVLDPSIHPLQPVLRSNLWLTVHVLTITISYAALMLVYGIGNVMLWKYATQPKPGLRALEALSQLAYRSLQFGVVLLAAGTILGGVWADYSWGRFWGWDPKEVWALIALLAYIAVLHARLSGWIGTYGFAVAGVVSFLTVLMAWYGVNFVLGVGLHSYGFASGGQAWVALFCALQLAFVGWVWLRLRRRSGVDGAVC